MHAKSLQSCPALCNPMDCSLPGVRMPVTSPDCHLSFWSTGYRLEGPITSLLGLDHFARANHLLYVSNIRGNVSKCKGKHLHLPVY